MLCVIQESKNTLFGTILTVKKWKDIMGRKEYGLYKINANKIMCLAYKNLMYCPDIILESDILKMRFTYENRYVIFFFNRYDQIDIAVGTIDGERKNYKWTKESQMEKFSDFLFSTHKLKGFGE